VRQNTFNGLAVEDFSDFLNNVRNVLVGLAGADQSQSAFESEVSGANNVSGATSEDVLGGLSSNDSVCALRNETVNVNTEIDFNDVSGLDHEGIIIVGRVVANAVVNRDASREGNTALELGPSLRKSFVDQSITESADLNDTSVRGASSQDLKHNSCKINRLILLDLGRIEAV
jgi:hypothetical protein